MRSVSVFTALLLMPALSWGQDMYSHLRDLSNSDKADGAVSGLVKIGASAVPKLIDTAREGGDMTARGWAIVALSRIPTDSAGRGLSDLQEDGNLPVLVRTWAAAGRINRAEDPNELFDLAKLQSTFPALDRPLKLRFTALVSSGKGMSAGQLLELSQRMPQLAQMISGPLLAGGAAPLVDVMAHGANDNLRRQAAAYLGSLAQSKGVDEVADAVAEAYRFDGDAKDVPWSGGALFVPGIQWPKAAATRMVRDLVAWHVWCDVRGKSDNQKQIHNNIRSLSLAGVVGYQSPGWNDINTEAWLRVWAKFKGKAAVRKLLRQQDAEKRYRKLLDSLR
jgi:acyl-CoA-binding protein